MTFIYVDFAPDRHSVHIETATYQFKDYLVANDLTFDWLGTTHDDDSGIYIYKVKTYKNRRRS